MTTLLTIGRLGRAAALTLVLAAPVLTTAAYAFDPFGGDESLVLKSAQSGRYNNPAYTPLARATADAKARMSPMAANPSGIASDASRIGGPVDLLGTGGQQDELAREIYHPGTGTDW
jgi:hypothetical protein